MQTLKFSTNLDQNSSLEKRSPINVVSRVVAFDKCIGQAYVQLTCPSDVLSMQWRKWTVLSASDTVAAIQ